jgi:outer membrane protein TolC
LTIQSVAALAALRNPALIAARARLGEADAQAYNAGLFPDPQISFTLDHPTSSLSSLVNAFSIGASYDVRALIIHGPAVEAADFARVQTSLDLEWQAWQVMQGARDLYIQSVSTAQKVAFLEQQVNIFRSDFERQERLLQTGDTTLDAMSAVLVSLTDSSQTLRATRRQLVVVRDQLAALLGLRAGVNPTLAGLPAPVPPRMEEVEALLGSVPDRRPDLLALRAGYRSQDSRLRGAILGQFPSLTVGFTRARDTSSVETIGFGVTLSLPIFDGNRGAVAIESATRARLRAEYQSRLDATASDVLGLVREANRLEDEIDGLEDSVAQLRQTAQRAQAAYEAGDFPALTYTTMATARYTQEVNLIERRQALWQALNALATLLGGGPVANELGVAERALTQ